MASNNQAIKPSVLRRVAGPPEFTAETKVQAAKNLNIILPVTIALLGIRVLFAFVEQSFRLQDVDIAIIVLTLVLGLLWVLTRRGYAIAAATLLLILIFTSMVYVASGQDKIFDGAFAALFVVILLAGVLLGWKVAIVMTALSIAVAWWLAGLTGGGEIRLLSSAPIDYARDVSIIFAFMAVLIYLLLGDLQRALSRSRANEQSMREQNTELTSMRTTLEQRVTERTTQLRTTAEVGRVAVSIMDPDELLKAIVALIAERFGFYYVAVFSLDQSGSYLILREATGEAGRILKERGHRLRIGSDSMVGYAALKREPRITLNASEDRVHFANPLLPDTQSEIALPLVVGDHVLGALDVQATQLNAFDESAIFALQNVAVQIAIALRNAESYLQLQQTLDYTIRQYELSRTIITAQTPTAAYESLGQVFAMLSGVDRISLVRVTVRDELGHPSEYELETEWDVLGGAQVGTGQRHSTAETPFANLVIEDEVVVISDAQDARLSPSTREHLTQAGVQAIMLVPLTVHGQYDGFVAAAAEQPHDFQDNEIRLMKSAAEQLGVVLNNLQLTAEMQTTLDRVALLNRRLSGETWGSYLESRDQWVVESGQAQSVLGPASLHIPIVVRGETIGTFDVADTRPDRQWQEEELTMLQTIAGEVALAIENARLIEQTQRVARREKDIATAADKIHRSIDLDTILQTAVEEVMRIAGTSEVAIQLGQPETMRGNGQSQEVPA